MRVERKGMDQVARILYREIDYEGAQDMDTNTVSTIGSA